MPDRRNVLIGALDGEFLANPYPFYAGLRREAPVQPVELNGMETWLVTRYEDAYAALADRRLSKDPRRAEEALRRAGIIVGDDGRSVGFGPNMLMSDPPDHTRLRRLVLEAFAPRRVEAMRPRVQEIADDLVDAVAPSGRADLVEDYAFPLPMTVICELLGVPVGDRDDFRTWAAALLKSPGAPEARAVKVTGLRALQDYFAELVVRRRPDMRVDLPGEGQPDLVSALIAANDHGGRLDEGELIGMLTLLLVAGHETMVHLICNGMLALLEHPDQLELLRARPELLPGAIEEALRYDAPVQRATLRIATEDVVVGGVAVPAGSVVVVVIGSADRDPSRFVDPDRFDIQRADNPHLSFGHGIHFCLGAPLARIEGQIAIGTLLARLPGIVLDEGPGPLRWHGGFLRGPASLPVRFVARGGGPQGADRARRAKLAAGR